MLLLGWRVIPSNHPGHGRTRTERFPLQSFRIPCSAPLRAQFDHVLLVANPMDRSGKSLNALFPAGPQAKKTNAIHAPASLNVSDHFLVFQEQDQIADNIESFLQDQIILFLLALFLVVIALIEEFFL